MEIFIVIAFCFLLPFSVLIRPIIWKIKNKISIIEFIKENKTEIVLFFILMCGSLIRLLRIEDIPNALNVDEASSGYDAFSLMKYGTDRNGNSWPVVLYAWGSGQSVLYSIITIPFVFIGGLTEFTIRAPMAIVGIVSLYVMYYLLKNIFDNKRISILGTFFLAICPWHIMKSRWGMECNLFPDLVLLAVFILVIGIKNKKAFLQFIAFALLGISAYSYATSYLFLPVFVCIVLLYLVYKKDISWKRAVLYLGIVFAITLPLILYLIINTFNLEQFSILGITIPRLQFNRYEEVSTIFSENLFESCVDNLLSTVRLLILQYDEFNWNALKGHGIVYLVSIPFLCLGVRAATGKYNKNKYNQLMNIWMVSSIVVAAFCNVNINRINIIMFPVIYYVILGIYVVIEKYDFLKIWIISIYLFCFFMFGYDYIKQDFNNYFTFSSGIRDLSEFCQNSSADTVYCYYSFKEPFIYFMFYQEYDVDEYLDTVEYFTQNRYFDNVKAFGKYKFYLPENVKENSIVIVPKNLEINYNMESKRKISINQFDIYEF